MIYLIYDERYGEHTVLEGDGYLRPPYDAKGVFRVDKVCDQTTHSPVVEEWDGEDWRSVSCSDVPSEWTTA